MQLKLFMPWGFSHAISLVLKMSLFALLLFHKQLVREDVESPSLIISKTWKGKALSNLSSMSDRMQ